jgi:hypothetical protein
MQHKSRQRIAGGGKFESERQRRFLWAVAPAVAHRWAHNLPTTKPDWHGVHTSSASVKRQTKRRR